MRPRTLVAVGLAITLAGVAAPAARAEDGYHHGRLRYVDPGVTVQRATDTGAEDALANAPFLPGDRVWTDGRGRADFQFPDGSVVRLDRRSKLDYAGHEEDREERIVLRLWSGSLIVRTRSREAARLEIETPAGTVQAIERSLVRVDADAGEVRVSVYEGEGVFDDGHDRVPLAAGERTFARWGGRAEQPERFDLDARDDFARWDEDRESDERWAANSSRYLPDELEPYAGEFERNGNWRYETTIGYVWIPQVEVGWRPYWNGRWTWTPYGWTWVPYERWGWAPFHYGRWDFSAAFGWYWTPGRTWGPAWVSWAVGGGYVGWCPMGRHDRPVVAWGSGGRFGDRYDRGRAVPRGRFGAGELDAWSVVRQGELGRRDVATLRVSPERIDPSALRVGETARFRPTRDAARLLQGDAVPRAIRTRPTPGDFVRELAVDNKTVPSPWFRRDGAGTRGEAPLYDRAPSRERGTDTVGAVRRGEDGVVSRPDRGSAAGGATPRSERSVPWFRAPEDAPRNTGVARPETDRAAGTQRPDADRGAAQRAPREDAERRAPSPWSSGSSVQPRTREEHGGGSPDSGAARRRDETAPRVPVSSTVERSRREESAAPVHRAQPRGGEVHSSGGGGESRPAPSSGGQARSSGGGDRGEHAAPRPHRRD